jgi:integrase
MIAVNFEYVHRDTDRHGNVRLYFRRRKGERKIRLRARPGTPDFQSEYDAAKTLSDSGALLPTSGGDHGFARLARPLPGTYRWLCTLYFASAEFRRLDPRTQYVRRRVLETTFDEAIAPNAKETFADFPLRRVTPKAIRVLRDRKADLPEAANNRVKAIRAVFSWALDNDHVSSNPAREVKRFSIATSGYHTWSVEEVAQYERRHPIGSKARLAFGLLMYTGVRRSDVVLLGRQHVRDGWLKFTAHKNRNRKPVAIELPILAVLQDILDASPTGDMTYLVTAHGRPFSANGFGNWFRDRCNEAGLPHCSAHGLRKAGATIAAENGATGHELMSIFGWLTLKEAEHYTQAARRKVLARSATRLLTRPQAEKGT